MSQPTQPIVPGCALITPAPPSGLRLVLTLSGIGFFCGILIVLTYQLTLPVIKVNKARALEKAIFEVVPGADSKAVFCQRGDALELLGDDEAGGRKYYACYTAGRLTGVAVSAAGQGFQDVVRLLYGYSPENQCIIGIKVLESKETPGLGTKIETDSNFQANFDALAVPLAEDRQSLANPITLVKPGKKTEPWHIEAITGATISSHAVATILAQSTAVCVPVIERNLDRLRGGAR